MWSDTAQQQQGQENKRKEGCEQGTLEHLEKMGEVMAKESGQNITKLDPVTACSI
jgi:hypothetical protein